MVIESFLTYLGAEGRERLARRMVTRHYRSDEMIIAQEDGGRDVYFVIRGLARATIYSADGKMVVYRDIREGGIFGELSAIDGSPRSATVSAVEDVTLGQLSVREFQDLVTADPDFIMALMRHFAEQARQMTERIFEFSTMLVRDRLLCELARLAEENRSGENAAEVDPAPTHFELAARISTHREAVSREISRLARRGLVEKSGRKLIVRDVAALWAERGSLDRAYRA